MIEEPSDLVKAVARVEEGGNMEVGIVRKGKQKVLTLQPTGKAAPWADPDHWGDWAQQRMHERGGWLRERLQELEQRIKDLEERLKEEPTKETQRET